MGTEAASEPSSSEAESPADWRRAEPCSKQAEGVSAGFDEDRQAGASLDCPAASVKCVQGPLMTRSSVQPGVDLRLMTGRAGLPNVVSAGTREEQHMSWLVENQRLIDRPLRVGGGLGRPGSRAAARFVPARDGRRR
jgi:hypothetical protein